MEVFAKIDFSHKKNLKKIDSFLICSAKGIFASRSEPSSNERGTVSSPVDFIFSSIVRRSVSLKPETNASKEFRSILFNKNPQ